LDGTLLNARSKKADNAVHYDAVSRCAQQAGAPHNDGFIGREELPRARETLPWQATLSKGGCGQWQGSGVTVRIARDLAEDRVCTVCRGEYEGRSDLGGGEVGEGEANEDD
jgi:hypothetical protein